MWERIQESLIRPLSTVHGKKKTRELYENVFCAYARIIFWKTWMKNDTITAKTCRAIRTDICSFAVNNLSIRFRYAEKRCSPNLLFYFFPQRSYTAARFILRVIRTKNNTLASNFTTAGRYLFFISGPRRWIAAERQTEIGRVHVQFPRKEKAIKNRPVNARKWTALYIRIKFIPGPGEGTKA